MKTNVKFFGLALAAVFTFAFVACSNPFFPEKKGVKDSGEPNGGLPQQLASPSNLQIDGATLTWNAVSGASGYTLDIDGIEYPADTAEFSLSVLTDYKTYTIKVKALGDGDVYTDSEWSASIEYEFEEPALPALNTPENLEISGTDLTWDDVTGALRYSVEINDVEHEAEANSYSLSALTEAGTYTIKVKAIGDNVSNKNSEWSQAIIYEFEDPSLTPDPIAFTDTQTSITKTYGAAAFTNAITSAHSGSGAITYSSGNETVATVSSSGLVSIHKAGTAVITARKAADDVYAGASKSYTLEVNAKAVTITGLSAANKFYDGTTTATITGTATISGLIGGDTVTVVQGTAAFASAAVGTGKTVTFSGFSLGGADAGNYSLTQPTSVTADIIDAELKPPMVQIPITTAVTFTMGSPESEPGRQSSNETQHEVTLTKGFTMSKYPVTQAQYEAVMGSNPSNFQTPVAPETSTANRPVEMVSWYDALVFCNKLSMLEELSPAYEMQTASNTAVWSDDPATWGNVPTSSDTRWNAVRIAGDSDGYRLPTEAQWEYACRAGTTTAFNDGVTQDWNDTTAVNLLGWYSGNSDSRTHSVGEKAANDWGLYDMHGNVYEWCWDWYDANYGGVAGAAATDPVGASSGSYRVRRGGIWYFPAQYARSAYRGNDDPDYRSSIIGLRLLRPAQ